MIRKTILTALVLSVAYSMYVAYLAPKWWHASQHQWQDNIIKAQKFLYDENDTIESVIIGSSLSNKLIMDSLPNTYNLSFEGLSIFDGLNLLAHKSNNIKNVFIEMNIVTRGENRNFTQSLNSPMLYYPRKAILALREDKQPIAVLGSIKMLVYKKVRSSLFPKQKKRNNTAVTTESNDGNSLFTKMLNLQIQEYSKIPDQQTLERAFNSLSEYVQKLESGNTIIVFFEMPVDYRLKDLPKAQIIRETFFEYFPRDRYHYILAPDSAKFETSDAVHLTREEAIRFTRYLKANSRSLR